MTKPPLDAATPPDTPKPPQMDRAKAERAARLASALRDNLRRRKAARAPADKGRN
jgi:hypothetical protein